jgi:hypothetical protein
MVKGWLGLGARVNLKCPLDFKRRSAYKDSPFSSIFFLLLLCFFITLFLSTDIGTTLKTTHPLYNDLE